MSNPDNPAVGAEVWNDLADARYSDWSSRETRSHWTSLYDELNKEKRIPRRVILGLRTAKQILTREVLERISVYENVAREFDRWEMLSKYGLDALRKRIVRSVSVKLASFRSRIRRQAAAVGYPQSALPPQRRYDDVLAELLALVNTALGRLLAEGDAHNRALAITSGPARASVTKAADGDETNRGAPEAVKGKRGRPQTIPDERKDLAAALKAAGGTNRKAAAIIYDTKYPTDQQVKNVTSTLRNHAKVIKRSSFSGRQSPTEAQ
jgi:hypothetical protein